MLLVGENHWGFLRTARAASRQDYTASATCTDHSSQKVRILQEGEVLDHVAIAGKAGEDTAATKPESHNNKNNNNIKKHPQGVRTDRGKHHDGDPEKNP